MNHYLKNTAWPFLWTATALFLSCSSDYNPFLDPSNARAVVKHMSFHDRDTIGIFSTETLQVEAAARDLVDSFSIESSYNRFFIDSTVRARPAQVIPAILYSFFLSFVDTGWQKITVSTFKKNGEKASVEYSLFCRSPLSQKPLTGNYYDTIVLSTTPVVDADVLYHWDLGGGQTFEKTTPVDKVPIASFLSGATGNLWVSDISEKNNSPKTQFSFSLKDTTGPAIVSINSNVKNDTIQTGDSAFTLLVRIIPLQNTRIVSDNVNGLPFDVVDTDQDVYVKTFFGVAAHGATAAPLIAQINAMDYFKNISYKIFYIVYNPTIGRSSGTQISVINPVLDSTATATSPTQVKLIYGNVTNYSAQPYDVYVRVRVNGAFQATADTLRLPFPGYWTVTASLSIGLNRLSAIAYTLGGDSCAAENFSLLCDPALAKSDSAPPVILDVSMDGAHNPYTTKDNVVLRIIAVGEGSGIETLSVNGISVPSSPEAKGYIWYDTAPAFHSQTSANNVHIEAIDSNHHETDTSISIYKNRLPIIVIQPNPPKPIIAGTAYLDSIVAIDPDGDVVTVKKAAGPFALAVSPNGNFQWTPTANDTGMQVVVLGLSDGYQSMTYNCSLFVALPTTTPEQPVKFLTTAQDFPAYLEVGKDSLNLTLQTINGTPPMQFSAYNKTSGAALSAQNAIVQWKPTLADTGLAALIITVTDLMKKSDTLLPKILIVPPNRPFKVVVSNPVPLTADGSLDMTKAAGPDTLRFSIADPDNPLVDHHTVTIIQAHSETVSSLDTSLSFMLILSPQHSGAQVLKDTIEVIVTDKAGHADSLTYRIVYQSAPTTKKIVVNTTAGSGGAGVAGMVLKFPALVRLDKTNFDFTLVNKAGSPLGFQKSDGSALPYEIEQWDSINGRAAIWVLVDTVYGNDSLRYFTVNWAPSLPSPQNGAAVFDTANGFQAVWHFSDGANAIAQDATINAYNGQPSGAVTDTTGVIGAAKVFDGQTGYFAMAGTAGGKLNFPLNGPTTVSAWVSVKVLDGNSHCMVSKSDHQYALQIRNNNQFEFMEFDNAQGWLGVLAPAAGQTWKYVVGVRNGTNQYIYVDGVLANATITVNPANGRDVSNDVAIGKLSGPSAGAGGGGNRFFNGKIDEVNMANVARSGDWIKLSFQNQKLGSTVVTIK
jgi:hypothetical protein